MGLCTSLSPSQYRRTISSPAYERSVAFAKVGDGVGVNNQQTFSQHHALASSTALPIPMQGPAWANMPKRSASEEEDNGPAKQIKTEQPEEFSNAVKKRLQSSSRTGQACDRCKVSSQSPKARLGRVGPFLQIPKGLQDFQDCKGQSLLLRHYL